ncbi:MAG: STAS/SEC14 domain-containing protein [Candidatus Eisenbacteria bacterium]|nr:STAS/SEC14 domain-containing protein [Candidatus Eisenbacteria bacterium]
MMTWTVECNEELGIIILTYSGVTTGEEIKKAAVARIDLGKKKGVTKFLIDTRTVKTDESATFDIYDVPNKIYPSKGDLHESRIAILEPESSTSTKMVQFFESVCVNRGWMVKIFQDRESAIRWL